MVPICFFLWSSNRYLQIYWFFHSKLYLQMFKDGYRIVSIDYIGSVEPLHFGYFLPSTKVMTWAKHPGIWMSTIGLLEIAKSKAEVKFRSPRLTNMKMSPHEWHALLLNKDCQCIRLIRNKMHTVSLFGHFQT